MLKEGVRGGAMLSDPYKRRYFVLRDGGYLSYYKSHQDFKDDSERAIKSKPINLADYETVRSRPPGKSGPPSSSSSSSNSFLIELKVNNYLELNQPTNQPTSAV